MASHSPDVMTIERAQKSFNEAVSLTGYGKYNIFVLLATGGCLMCVIIETMNMSFIIPAAQCDLHLTLSEKGILVSISFLGVITTSHFWGFMADYRGRRNILILSLITSSILSIIGSVIPWAWLFILLRYINGAFIGGASSIIYAFAGEFHDDYYRPKVISWVSAFVALGQMYIPGMAWAILSQKWEFPVDAFGITFRPWRLLIIAYALPSLIVAAMMSILPESPKFLLAKGKHDHTIKILRKMFVINTGKNSIEYPVCTVFLDEFVTEQSTEKKTNFFKLIWKQSVLLFKKEFRLKTILICYLQFGVFLSASALALWFPQILNSLSKFAQTVGNANVTLCGSIMNEEVSQTKYSKFLLAYKGNFWRSYDSRIDDGEICDDSVDTSVFLVVLLIAVAIMITYIVIGIFINKLGKKSILVGKYLSYIFLIVLLLIYIFF
ncbi:hypothetical protein ABEB36_003747 [Hypothenemus hampei]|uniref:Major facilitator superfamily (MFS) profile domain-containing protein n=1 Tax=Hypothenemus hampei TaxID=57062 RepID=A0ABD1F298_HYPHA